MASRSPDSTNSVASSRRTIIVTDLPNTIAPTRSRRGGGRLHSLGSLVNRSRTSSAKGSSSKTSSSRTKAYSTPKSTSKGKAKDSTEPLAKPLVSETIP